MDDLSKSPVKDEAGALPASGVKPARKFSAWIAVAAALVLAVTAISYIALNRIKDNIRENLASSLQTIMSTTLEASRQWANEQKKVAMTWARNKDLIGAVKILLDTPREREALLNSPALSELDNILNPAIESLGYEGFIIIAPDHVNLASMLKTNIGDRNVLADDEGFLPKVFAGAAALSIPTRSMTPLAGADGEMRTGEPTMFVAAPILDETGAVIAALAFRINPSREFTFILQLGRASMTGETYAFDRQGRLLTESRFDSQLLDIGLIKPGQRAILSIEIRDPGGNMTKGFKPRRPMGEWPLTRMAASATAGEEGVDVDGYRDYRGVDVVGAWKWDSELGFGVTTELDAHEAYRPYRTTRLIVLSLVVFVVAIFFIYSLMLLGSRRRAVAKAEEAFEANMKLRQQVAERKKIEKALIESEEQIRRLLESTEEAICGIDRDGNITFANPAFLSTLKYDDVDVVLGRNLHRLMHYKRADGSPFPDSECEIFRVLWTGETLRSEEEAFWKSDGTMFYGEYFASPIKVNGVITGAVVNFNDITERKLAFRELRKSRESLSRAQRVASIGNWEWDIKANDLEWSDEVYRIFGVDKEKFAASYEAFTSFIHPEDREFVRKAVDRAVRENSPYNMEHRIIRPDGAERIVHEIGEVSHSMDGEPLRMVGTVQDITERKLAEDRITLAGEVFENVIEGVIVTAPNSRITYVNPAFTTITGYSSEEAVGKTPSLLRSDRHDEIFYKNMWTSLTETGQWQGEIWNRRKSGEAYLEWLTITAIKDRHGRASKYVGVFYDITEIRQSEEKIKYQANYDALTELPNRTLFLDRLTQAMAKAVRTDSRIAALIVDLDRFKNINDSLGHAVGDVLLQNVSKRLGKLAVNGEGVARMGGDEFAFFLEDSSDGQEAVKLAHKITHALSFSFLIKGHELFITASIGIAIFPEDGLDVQVLIKNAEAAMYKAKEQGRDTYQLYTSAMNTRAFERLALENAMRKAIELEEFIVYYQPKLDIKTGVIVGCEALIRWRRQDGSLVSPMEFIPLAEETGLITPIGKWALREACRKVKAWHDEGFEKMTLAVNLSARQFQERFLIEDIRSAMTEIGYRPEQLELEITESTAMKDAESATRVMRELSEMGMRISIDDFGTGYSSLNYLKRFPIDALKIDKSFVRDIPGDTDDSAIADMIIAMAKSLGLKVIAEGVETKEQLKFLRERGCDEMQGYLFSPPVPQDKFEEMLRKGAKLG